MDKFILIGAFLLLVTSLVRFLTIAKWSLPEKFLSIALLALLVNTIVLYVYFQENLYFLTYLYRWGTLSTILFIPACFHYLKYAMTKDKLKPLDLILYLPALIYFLDFLPFFLLDYHSKYDAMLYDLNRDIAHLHVQSNIMPFGTYFFIQNAMGCALSIWLLSVTIPNTIRAGGKSYFVDNRSLVLWNITLSLLLFITCLPDLLFSITGKRFDFKSFTYVTPCLFLYSLFPLSILLAPLSYRITKGFWINKIHQLRPAHVFSIGDLHANKDINDILSHSQELLFESKHVPENVSLLRSKIDKTYIDSMTAQNIKQIIDKTIIDNQLYNQNDLDIAVLANLSSLPESQVQALLNDYLHTSPTHYISQFKQNQ